MHRKVVSWLLVFVGWLLLLAGVFEGHSLVGMIEEMNHTVSMNKVAVSLKSNTSGSNAGFTLEDMKKLKTALKKVPFAYSGETSSRIKFGSGTYPVVVIGTNDFYGQFVDLNIQKGAYFTQQSEERNERVAVIEDTLAWELYQTDDVLGMKIEIFGSSFKIIGISKKDRSIVQSLSDTGVPRVYIPANTWMDLDENAVITNFQAAAKEGGVFGEKKDEITAALMKLGENPTNYIITDFNIERALITQKPRLLLFIIGMANTLMIAVYIRRRARQILGFLSEEMKIESLAGILRKHWKELSITLLGGLTALVVLAALWKTIAFDFYIPPQYVPDNLTDVSYFIDLIKTHWQTENANAGDRAPYFQQAYNAAVTLLNSLFYLALTIGLGLLLTGLYQLRILSVSFDKAGLYGSVVMVLGIGTLWIAANFLSIPFVVPVKEIWVTYGFLFGATFFFTTHN